MTFNDENPFAHRSTLPYELPPFASIREEHYLDAFYAGCSAHLAEIDEILGQSDVTFENTVVAMERTGALLTRGSLRLWAAATRCVTQPLDGGQK